MTLREALSEILTPAGLAELVDQELEREYIVAAALFRVRDHGAGGAAARALIAWCRSNGSVWIIEDGDRRLEAPPAASPL